MRLGSLRCRTGRLDHLVVSADGKSIFGLRWANRPEKNCAVTYLDIWDAVTGELRQTRDLPDEFSLYLAVSSDGRLILTRSGTICDLPTGKPVRTFDIDEQDWFDCAVFSPDGKHVAGVLQHRPNDTVVVWSVATGKRIFSHNIDNQVFGSQLIFSPDGKRLLLPLTTHEGGMRCFDIPGGRLLWENKQLTSYSFVITPDGKVLSAQPLGSVVDLATGRPIDFPQMPPVGLSNRLTLTPDGHTLFVADANGVRDVIVWDLVHGKGVRRLPRAGDFVVVAPDGKSVITSNGALQRWDLATGKPMYPDTFARGHARNVIAVTFSADGSRLASASWDGTVRLWDTATGRPLRVWAGHRGWDPIIDLKHWIHSWGAGAEAVDMTPDGRYVLSGGGDEYLRLWGASSEKEILSIALPRHEGEESEHRFHCLRISPDGGRATALFGSRYGTAAISGPGIQSANKLAVWSLKTGKMLTCHPVPLLIESNSAISPDGRTVLVDGTLVDIASGKEIGQLTGGKGGLTCAFSGDGALVVGEIRQRPEKNQGGRESFHEGATVWETVTGKIVAQLPTNPNIAEVHFHPDNRFVAENNKDGLKVWDVRSGQVVFRLRKQEPMPGSETPYRYGSCLAFTPDGRRLATGHPDSTILLWDVPLPPPKRKPLAAKELESLWRDLADADAAKAWRAVWSLSDSPDEVMPLLRARLKPVPVVPEDAMRKLVTGLDDSSFAVRDAAAKRLKELGLQAEPGLHAALKAKPSLEQRRRIEELLAALPAVPPPPSVEELRQLRALIVLEYFRTPEARRLLEDVAKGQESARLTQQARATLMCLH
jgi:WD40 repeat protein